MTRTVSLLVAAVDDEAHAADDGDEQHHADDDALQINRTKHVRIVWVNKMRRQRGGWMVRARATRTSGSRTRVVYSSAGGEPPGRVNSVQAWQPQNGRSPAVCVVGVRSHLHGKTEWVGV